MKRLFMTISVIILLVNIVQAAQVTLAWDPNPNNLDLDGYRIFQRLEGQAYDYTMPACQTADTTCTIYDLPENTVMYFVARSFGGNDMSGDSNEVAFRTGDAVTNLTTDAIVVALSQIMAKLEAIERLLSIRTEYCGNPDSKIVHKSTHWCGDQAVHFKTLDDAITAGYIKCKRCLSE